MKGLLLVAIFLNCSLFGVSSGAPHDAWSEWIIAQSETPEENLDVVQSDEEVAADDDKR